MQPPLEISDLDTTLRDIAAKLTALVTLCVEENVFSMREFESFTAQALQMIDERQTRLAEEKRQEQEQEVKTLKIKSRRIEGIDALIVGAPFGNYIGGELGLTRTYGTFTPYARRTDQMQKGVYRPRDERFWWFGMLCRYFMTVRRQRAAGGWVNRMGLRNPGIERAVAQINGGYIRNYSSILSITALTPEEWTLAAKQLIRVWPGTEAVELNFSCPNVKKEFKFQEYLNAGLESLLNWRRAWRERHNQEPPGPALIAKFGPTAEFQDVSSAVEAGCAIHLCNTLPVDKGGLSGAPLKPIALQMVRVLHYSYPGVPIIGGGGVRTEQDIQDYFNAGASHVSIASALFKRKYRKRLPQLAKYAKEHQPL